jgi:hypothetical protein
LTCSLDFFNFSLRGTKIHPKKPAFLRPIKSFICLKYMPRLHLLPSRISKFSRRPGPPSWTRPPLTPMALQDMPVACPVSTYFQKFSIYLKTFWEPCLNVNPCVMLLDLPNRDKEKGGSKWDLISIKIVLNLSYLRNSKRDNKSVGILHTVQSET